MDRLSPQRIRREGSELSPGKVVSALVSRSQRHQTTEWLTCFEMHFLPVDLWRRCPGVLPVCKSLATRSSRRTARRHQAACYLPGRGVYPPRISLFQLRLTSAIVPLPQPSYGCLICLTLGSRHFIYPSVSLRERLDHVIKASKMLVNVARSSSCIDAQVACKKFGKVPLFLSNGLSQKSESISAQCGSVLGVEKVGHSNIVRTGIEQRTAM